MTVIVPGGTLRLHRQRVTALSWPTVGDISVIGWCRRRDHPSLAGFGVYALRLYVILNVTAFYAGVTGGADVAFTLCSTPSSPSIKLAGSGTNGPTTPFSQDCVVDYPAPEDSKYIGLSVAEFVVECTDTTFPASFTIYDPTAPDVYAAWERGDHLCTFDGTHLGSPATFSYDLMHTTFDWA